MYIGIFSLTGCNPYSKYFHYEIEYPSGRLITSYYWEDSATIENSDLSLSIENKSSEDKAVIKLLGEDGEELWTKERPLPFYRGQVVDGELWVCEEVWGGWDSIRFSDGLLESGKISCVDITTGETKWEQTTGEHEFFLAKVGERFYFYERGERKKWGADEHAHLYYRTMEEWEEKRLIYEFDFAETPPKASVEYRMKFSIQEDAIEVEYRHINNNNEILWTIETPMEPEQE